MTSGWTFQEVVNGGDVIDLTLEGVMEGGSVAAISAVEQVGSTPGPDPDPTPTGARRLGMYNGPWSEAGGDPDGEVHTLFGHWPMVASSYYLQNQNGLNVAKETTRINRGIAPLINLATKPTQYLVGLAGLDTTANNTAARNWLDVTLGKLDGLSRVDPSVPVYFTVDQEFEVRVANGTTTGAAANYATYGKALSYMFARMDELCPLVKKVFWYGGASSRRTDILAIWKNIATASPPDMVLFDPYAKNSTTSPSGTWSGRVTDVRTGTYKDEWIRLGRPPLGLAETGINKINVNDATSATWISNMPAAMEALDLALVVYFNRDSGDNGNWKLTGGTNMPRPLSVAAFGQALLDVNGA